MTVAKPLREQTKGELGKLANNGDQAACDHLYARLDAEGCAEDLIEGLTEIAPRVLSIAHEPLVKEAYVRKMAKMRDALGYKNGSALERLLIDRIVMCWYNLSNVEATYAEKMLGSVNLEMATYLMKALDRSEGRYQAAVKSLAVVRRLQLPVVQVNIGEKQINIVQGAGTQANAVLTGGNAEGVPATPIM